MRSPVRVTRKTTLLIVGMQDGNVVGDAGKSSRHRKAGQLVRDGAESRIATEEDCRLICGAPPIAPKPERPEKPKRRSGICLEIGMNEDGKTEWRER